MTITGPRGRSIQRSISSEPRPRLREPRRDDPAARGTYQSSRTAQRIAPRPSRLTRRAGDTIHRPSWRGRPWTSRAGIRRAQRLCEQQSRAPAGVTALGGQGRPVRPGPVRRVCARLAATTGLRRAAGSGLRGPRAPADGDLQRPQPYTPVAQGAGDGGRRPGRERDRPAPEQSRQQPDRRGVHPRSTP